MIRETIIKLISQSIGDGFIWKTLGFIFISLSSALAFYLKMVHDVELRQQQIVELTHSLKESQEYTNILVQNQIDHLNQTQIANANREFYINLSYIGTFFMVIGGVIVLNKFFPHILEYIWPTNKANIGLINTMNDFAQQSSTQMGTNQITLIELLSGKFDIVIKNQIEIQKILNQILTNQNTASDFALSALRRTQEFGFRPKN